MKVVRSSKCSLKFATREKRRALESLLQEYGNAVNYYINKFWGVSPPIERRHLLKDMINGSPNPIAYRLKQAAADEAIGMIKASVNRKGKKGGKPHHRGLRMMISSKNAELKNAKTATHFDKWLHLFSLGGKLILDLPIKLHRHFNTLLNTIGSKRLNSYIITRDYVQFCFEVDIPKKRDEGIHLGLDTGIKKLAATSDGNRYGTDIQSYINCIALCQHGSKEQKRRRRALRQRMDEVAKEITTQPNLQTLVIENLKNLNYKTRKRRILGRKMRVRLGNWNYAYWLDRLKQQCEWNRVRYITVRPHYTSQRCSMCGHTERKNRSYEEFSCLKCGHSDDADVNAARNILDLFVSGAYGPGSKPLIYEPSPTLATPIAGSAVN